MQSRNSRGISQKKTDSVSRKPLPEKLGKDRGVLATAEVTTEKAIILFCVMVVRTLNTEPEATFTVGGVALPPSKNGSMLRDF